MNKTPVDSIDRALAAFPKLYYYVPPLPDKIQVGNKKVLVKAPRDTTLWLLEALATDSNQPYCLHNQLYAIVKRWHPMKPGMFSRLTSRLHQEGYLKKTPNVGPHGPAKNKRVALTRKGQELLAAIKKERRENVVKFLFNGLSESKQNKLADNLEAVAFSTWAEMKKAIKRTPSAKR